MDLYYCVFVCAVVANVMLGAPPFSVNTASVRNTSAKPGTGTLTVHVCAVVWQFTVSITSLLWRRIDQQHVWSGAPLVTTLGLALGAIPVLGGC
ncbi:hypothetical protein B0H17DRAFT_1219764 [Mycena rosella]|uniref:Uncharacterized protein n=1 Tax=Mycena rosella TaxID=1033263 RepID=A0AAD7BEP5_MYCRO|nr:hypothetical protein B0H17DRAFT_1219764 [Mycena rosella]